MNRFIKSIAVLSIVLSVVLVAGTGFALADTQQPSGSGTSSDPYQITNWHELAYMNESLDAVYELQNDLTSDTAGYDEHAASTANSGAGWKPVGTVDTEFTGSLNGQGYKIDSINIDRSNTDRNGLFGDIDGATVQNIQITNANITAGGTSGILTGMETSSSIQNVHTSGTIEGKNGKVGGIAGITDGVIENSSSSANVKETSGSNKVGGLAGRVSGTINNSYSTGDVTATDSLSVGGIAGTAYADFNNVYSTGDVSGGDDVGGIIGSTGSDMIADGWYSYGNVTGQDSTDRVGGVVGDIGLNNPDLSNSYWDDTYTIKGNGTEVDGQGYDPADSVAGEPVNLTTSEMQGSSAETNMNFDFVNDWETVESSGDATNDGYPVLQSQDREAQLLAQDGTDPVAEYNLTINSEDNNWNSVDTTYTVTDSDGNEVASGSTGTDGQVVETLAEGNYTVMVAQYDDEYDSQTSDITLSSDSTESFGLSASLYDLTVNTTDSDGNAINTTYTITDSDEGVEVASGTTGADGQVVRTLNYGNYTVSVAEDDPEYASGSTDHELTSDYTMLFERDSQTYDLTVEATDSDGNSINTTYSIEDSDGAEVASGETGSDGTAIENLVYGDYTVTLSSDDPEYDTQTSSVTLDSSTTETQSTTVSEYDLTVETTDSSGSSVDTDYTITNSSGTQVASGSTGTDGQVTHTLTYDDYDVTVASDDARFVEDTRTVTLDSTQTQSFSVSDASYDLTITAEDGSGSSVDTDYSVENTDGNEVASGSTGADGSATETLTQGDYTVIVASSDSTYVESNRSITLSSDSTESFTLSTESYEATIESYDSFEEISTDYEIEDENGNVVASGTTDETSEITETLDAGTYTITYASDDDEVYTTEQTFTLDSDGTVVDSTLDRIGLSLTVSQDTIYTGNEVTFDADVENRDDANYNFDWYVNNESVATGHGDTYNHTFNDSGEYQVRAETTIDGNDYVATRPIPDFTWVDTDTESGDDPAEVEDEMKVEFQDLEISTVDANGSVVATHYVNANLRENLTGDEIGEDRIRVAKKGETTQWQIIATHDAYIRAEHPDYQNQFAEVDWQDLQTSTLYAVQLGFGEGEDLNVTSYDEEPDSFGYDLIQEAVIISGDGGVFGDDEVGVPGIPGIGGIGGLFGLLGILVIGASILIIAGGFSLLKLLTPGAGGEGLFGGEESITDHVPNPLRWFNDD